MKNRHLREIDIESEIATAEAIKNFTLRILKQKTFSARMEFVVRVTDFSEPVLHAVLSSCNEFRQQHQLIHPTKLSFVDYEDFYAHASKYMDSSANTILHELKRLDHATRNQIPMHFSINDFLNVAAAEAILCFFIYGSSMSILNRRSHFNELCRDIGINQARFASMVELYPDLPNITVDSGINYNPTYPIMHLIPEVVATVGNLTFSEAVLRMWADGNDRGSWKEVAPVVYELVLEGALIRMKKNHSQGISATEILSSKYKNIKVVRPRTFIDSIRRRNDNIPVERSKKHSSNVGKLCVPRKRGPLEK